MRGFSNADCCCRMGGGWRQSWLTLLHDRDQAIRRHTRWGRQLREAVPAPSKKPASAIQMHGRAPGRRAREDCRLSITVTARQMSLSGVTPRQSDKCDRQTASVFIPS
jgi:hypothetical protein